MLTGTGSRVAGLSGCRMVTFQFSGSYSMSILGMAKAPVVIVVDIVLLFWLFGLSLGVGSHGGIVAHIEHTPRSITHTKHKCGLPKWNFARARSTNRSRNMTWNLAIATNMSESNI